MGATEMPNFDQLTNDLRLERESMSLDPNGRQWITNEQNIWACGMRVTREELRSAWGIVINNFREKPLQKDDERFVQTAHLLSRIIMGNLSDSWTFDVRIIAGQEEQFLEGITALK